MRVLFVSPPWHCLHNKAPMAMPLGLCYLAAVLREHGHECLIYDGDLGFGDEDSESPIIIDYERYHEMTDSHIAWDKAESVVREFNPDVCGITFTTGAYASAKKMAGIAKKCNPDTTVVLGGPHATLLPEETLKDIDAEAVVRNEGENSLLELVSCLEENKPLNDVLGISYKLENGAIKHNAVRPLIEDLDSLPFPARDLVVEKEKYKIIPIFTSRGCPFKCNFCASHKIWGRKVRYRSLDNVIAEIEMIKSEFGSSAIRIVDDTFTLKEKNVVQFCDMLRAKQLDVKWLCYGRVDTMTEKMLVEMKKAGCAGIFAGVESGNPDILKSVQKGITVNQVVRAFELTKKVGIKTSAYFMMGFPAETKKQILDTVKLWKKIDPNGFSCWNIVTPYPGTELYEIAKDKKLLPENIDWSDFFHQSEKVNLSSMHRDEFLKLAKKIQNMVEQRKERKKKRDEYRNKIEFGLKHPILLCRKLLNKLTGD